MSSLTHAQNKTIHRGDHSTTSRISLPGFGHPLNLDSNHTSALFKNALDPNDLQEDSSVSKLSLLTLREITMLQIIDEITDKPDWESKVLNEEIVAKWKEELARSDRDISQPMIDWCISELRYKADLYSRKKFINVYKGDVVKSDTIVPDSVKNALQVMVTCLEDIPEREKDWHPGSKEKVLDLVHPSLYPLVYGRTRILADGFTTLNDCIKKCGEGEIIPIPEIVKRESRWLYNPVTKNFYSKKFQWLPCEVDISGEDGKAKITSYINNLHPQKHKDLYGIIEDIISCAIPLWNASLSPLRNNHHATLRIPYTEVEYDLNFYRDVPATEGPQREPNETDWEFWKRRQPWAEEKEEWIKENRNLVLPEPPEFSPSILKIMNPATSLDATLTEETVDLLRDYGKRGLQVIVKLANICLTPERPQYEGGTWHVEGQINEHICASALYYYSCHNITPSRLAFRQQADVEEASSEINYEQNEHGWLEPIFGCEQDGPGIQVVGSVETREGRLVTFPNILQHQVQPFKLQDPTKPGWRKIVALFLVDPNVRIISTANVPCQQMEWWAEEVLKDNGNVDKGRDLSILPPELQEMVFKEVMEFPIKLEDAKELRLELMEERKVFVVKHSEAFEAVTFSLCEH